MKTTVYLIRHGEVEYKRDDQGRRLIYGANAHLSVEGSRQIERLAQKLKQEGVRFDALYTSPYTRAIKSAQIIFNILGETHVRIRKGLHDIWAPGWVAVPMDELKTIGGDIYSQPPRSEDQETLQEMDTRITTILGIILKESQGKIIGIVGHGDPIRMLIYRLQNRDGALPKMSELTQFDYLHKGQAWRLLFGENNSLIEKELITPDERLVKGERVF